MARVHNSRDIDHVEYVLFSRVGNLSALNRHLRSGKPFFAICIAPTSPVTLTRKASEGEPGFGILPSAVRCFYCDLVVPQTQLEFPQDPAGRPPGRSFWAVWRTGSRQGRPDEVHDEGTMYHIYILLG